MREEYNMRMLIPSTLFHTSNTCTHDEFMYVCISHMFPLVCVLFYSFQFSVRAIRGARMTMEDRFFVASGGKFAAVFDGHGGAGVSEYLKDHLYDNVCRYLQLKHWEESDDTINNCRGAIPSVSSQAAALRAAFEQVEVDVIADDSLKYVGSTAVAVVVHEGEDGHRTLMSANVGDSRAILSRKGKAVNLTRDHKPSDEREKARILAMGEEIEWDNFSKVHRVRSLSLSRAIGDRYAKPAVSSEVEIRHFSVAEEGDDFVLLASDGLWDVMTSQEVVNFVRERLDPDGQWVDQDEVEDVDMYLRDNMAKFVAREGIRRGSGDNICVVLVFLNDPKKKKMPVIV
jgi:serine/threonine protein phosphatase PrpC